jgi:hypothetical protein
MSTTRIFVTKDAALAAQTAGMWTDGDHTVHAIGPTDRILVKEADESASHWDSQDGPWYAVVATPSEGGA